MKKNIFILLIIHSLNMSSQKPLDTIYANEHKNVAMFFPETIRQGVTGAEHFVFTYNRETEQYFGLLQATPGEESNLLAITKDGYIYSYVLKYKEDLTKLNYFISENESIGNEKPEIKVEENTAPKKPKSVRSEYFQKFSEYLLKSKKESLAVEREKGLKLTLEKMVYNASEVYLVFEIKNRSNIDFEIDYLKVYRVNGNKKRKASYQKLEIEVVQSHSIPNQVKNGKAARFVYVFPKFVLGENEKLMLELKELNGDRKLELFVKN